MIEVKTYSKSLSVKKEYQHYNKTLEIVIDAEKVDNLCDQFNSLYPTLMRLTAIQPELANMLDEWKKLQTAIEKYPAVAESWKNLQTVKNLCENEKAA